MSKQNTSAPTDKELAAKIEEAAAGSIFFPPSTCLCSEHLSLFLRDFEQLVDHFQFTVDLANNADRIAETAAKALLKVSFSPEKKKKIEEHLANPTRMSDRLGKYATLNSRNLLVNTVDAFLWYFSAIIQQAMKRRPEMLKSSETLSVKDVLSLKTRGELLNYIIDKKINALSYGGMGEMEQYLQDRLGIEIFDNEDQRRLMKIFIELRNIHTHNRGQVNKLFLSRISNHESFKFELHQRFHLNYETFQLLSKTCLETAIKLDAKVTAKFGLKAKRYVTWYPEPVGGTQNPLLSNFYNQKLYVRLSNTSKNARESEQIVKREAPAGRD